MTRLLALDFDGVVADTAPECFVTALRTFCELRPDSPLHRGEGLLRGPAAPPPEAVHGHPLYPPFLEMMALGNRAEDFGVEMHLLEGGRHARDQAEYDAFKAELAAEDLKRFHKRFYRVRHAMADADPAGWHRLMGPYPGVPELLRRRAGDAELAIATSKDRRSVGVLLEAFGIADLFPEGRVLDKETGADKRSHLELLHGATGVPFAEMVFLDDKVNHLQSVAALGVRCGLAGWGYNGEREARLARSAGWPVLSLDELEARVFGGSWEPEP